MGLNDRDWYREEIKQARRAANRQPPIRPAPTSRQVPRSPPVDLNRFFPEKPALDLSVFGRQFLLFTLLILAIYGAISLVQHITNKPPKTTPATSPAVLQPSPKPPPQYHIKRAPTV